MVADNFVSEPLLLTEEKKQQITYPKNQINAVPSWALSLKYAAEINYLHYYNELIDFDVNDLLNRYQFWSQEQTDECSYNGVIDNNLSLSCAVKFAKNTNYSFKKFGDSTNYIQLKNYELLNIKNINDVKNGLNIYPVLYANMFYNNDDKSVQEIEIFKCSDETEGQPNCQSVQITEDANSACLIIGIHKRIEDSATTYYSEILHPFSQFTSIDPNFCQYCYKYQFMTATSSALNNAINQDITPSQEGGTTLDMNFRRLYSVVYGLNFNPSHESITYTPTTNINDGDNKSTSKEGSKNNVGLIVGCSVGSVCLVGIGVAIFFIVRRYKCGKVSSIMEVRA